MMDYDLHPIFREVPEPDAPLWRYMSFAKLASMLESGRLRFTRIDRFDDHFEGVWPRKDLEAWNRISTLPAGVTEQMRRSYVAASCWVNLAYESAGMWRLYAPGNEGVAIKTTFGKLCAAMQRMENAPPGTVAGAAKMQYLDHATDSLLERLKKGDPLPNLLIPFMLKHKSYEHEREVRALVVSPLTHEIDPNGCVTAVLSLPDFIEKVVTNPLSEPWFEQVVVGLAKAHDMRSIERSALHPRTFWQRVILPKRSAPK